MGRLTSARKEEIQAKIALTFSGFEINLGYNLCRYFRSLVSRDFKALAQIALFLLTPYMKP